MQFTQHQRLHRMEVVAHQLLDRPARLHGGSPTMRLHLHVVPAGWACQAESAQDDGEGICRQASVASTLKRQAAGCALDENFRDCSTYARILSSGEMSLSSYRKRLPSRKGEGHRACAVVGRFASTLRTSCTKAHSPIHALSRLRQAGRDDTACSSHSSKRTWLCAPEPEASSACAGMRRLAAQGVM